MREGGKRMEGSGEEGERREREGGSGKKRGRREEECSETVVRKMHTSTCSFQSKQIF